MINPNFERRYIPGTPIFRGCWHCNNTVGVILWTVIFIICVGLGGYRLFGRYTEFTEAKAMLVQTYYIDPIQGPLENPPADQEVVIGKPFPNITICNVNPIVYDAIATDSMIQDATQSAYVQFLYFTTSQNLTDSPEIQTRYEKILKSVFEGSLCCKSNTDDLNLYFSTIFDGSTQIDAWANTLRNSIIDATDPLFMSQPNNITQYVADNPDKIDIDVIVQNAYNGVIDKHSDLDIQFRNNSFTALLYNSLRLGGIYTEDYQSGLSSILTDEMLSAMNDEYGTEFDTYTTGLFLSKAAYALANLNFQTKTDGFSGNSKENPYGNLLYSDRNNQSMVTPEGLDEKNFAISKLLEDFSWIQPGVNGSSTKSLVNAAIGNQILDLGPNFVAPRTEPELGTQKYITRHGECLKIESSKLLTQKSNGLQNGLSLIIDAGQAVNIPWKDYTGLLVHLHGFGDEYPLFDHNFYYTPLKSTLEISVSSKMSKRLPKPKGTCESPPEANPVEQSVGQCLEKCEIKFLEKNCDCAIGEGFTFFANL